MASDFLSELREKTRTPEEIKKERIEKFIETKSYYLVKQIKEKIVEHAKQGKFQVQGTYKKIEFEYGISSLDLGFRLSEKEKQNDFLHINVIDCQTGLGIFRGSADHKYTVNIFVKDIVYKIVQIVKKELNVEGISFEIQQKVNTYSFGTEISSSYDFSENIKTITTNWNDKSIKAEIIAKILVVY